MSSLILKVKFRKDVHELAVSSTASTVREVNKLVAQKIKLDINRVELRTVAADKKDVKKLDDGSKKLSDYGIKADTPLEVKDLGPQIGYRTVFIVEYLGPILIVLLYALRPELLYGQGASKQPWSQVAVWGLWAWLAHFIKREIETVFVHKFSRPTMPLFNIFKNSMYYWGFALFVGYVLCHPAYSAPTNMTQVYLGIALMLVSECVNLAVHLQFAGMRPAEGSKKRDTPSGPLFALVSCPNYTAEVLSWVGFSIFTQISFAYMFTFVGLAQMTQWALAKHRGYIRSDPAYKKKGRKAIIPFVI